MYDIIFCNLPFYEMNQIYSAPAILKGVVQSNGYRAKTFDFSIDLLRLCDNDKIIFSNIQNYFITRANTLTDQENQILTNWYDYVCSTLKNLDTKYIGFSVFSSWTHKATLELLIKLKELNLTDKIILGGRGIKTAPFHIILNSDTDEVDAVQWFGIYLKNKQLVNHVIIGDGEDAILSFLKNGTSSNRVHSLDILTPAYPDYSDYDFNNYEWIGEPSIQIKGSQGCVRNCDFCDIKEQFGSYLYKDGDQLADELINLQSNYNINKFIFVDSLVNGSMKHFKTFIKKIAEHNQTHDRKIVWTGQYISRDYTNKENIEEYYDLLKKSGAEGLTIGAESGSNHVLESIDKKTSVEALFYELEYFKKYQITTYLLTFVGHWSETLEDFKKHCMMLYNLRKYDGTICNISLGGLFNILSGTPSFYNKEIIKHKVFYNNLWYSKTNFSNTLKQRLIRRLIIHKLGLTFNLPFDKENEKYSLKVRYDFVVDKVDMINGFFKDQIPYFKGIDDVDNFIESFLKENNINLPIVNPTQEYYFKLKDLVNLLEV